VINYLIVTAGNGQSLCRMKAVLVGHSIKSAAKLVQTGILRTSSLPDSTYALPYVCSRDDTHKPSAGLYCKLI